MQKITYFTKEAITCPACESTFYREELLSGSGRLIAGELTDELCRFYEPSKKFGEVFPLIYSVTVCPKCLFAALPQDFVGADASVTGGANAAESERRNALDLVFPDLDFREPRELGEGVASYFLAISCYDLFPKLVSPTIKQGLCALRAAWLLGEMHRKRSNENYDYLAMLFYRKARFFYVTAVDREQGGKEPLGGLIQCGPDLDHNYGYDGVLYLSGLLEFKYGPRKNAAKRLASLEKARRVISRVHGMGKASRAKPTPLLERVHELFDRITEEVKALGAELGGEPAEIRPSGAGEGGGAP